MKAYPMPKPRSCENLKPHNSVTAKQTAVITTPHLHIIDNSGLITELPPESAVSSLFSKSDLRLSVTAHKITRTYKFIISSSANFLKGFSSYLLIFYKLLTKFSAISQF